MTETDKLHPSRIVYHRGSVVYARFKFGGPDDYRHPLDVPNGLGCGCVCDECNEQLVAYANDSAKVAAKLYKKIPHFAHQSHSKCAPGGERGLLEAFRVAVDFLKSIHLPAAFFSSGNGQTQDVLFRPAAVVEVLSFTIVPKVSGQPHELLLETAQGKVRLLVATRLPSPEVVAGIKQQALPTVVANMIPDVEGIIFMGDVLDSVQTAEHLAWLSLPEMDAHATEQRKNWEAEQERIRLVDEEARRKADELNKEKLRRMEEEAEKSGLVKLLCAACKTEIHYGRPSDDYQKCTVCHRMTSFYPIKTTVQSSLPVDSVRPRYF
jgi:hypothetical protein